MTRVVEGEPCNGRVELFAHLAAERQRRDPSGQKPTVCLFDGERARLTAGGPFRGIAATVSTVTDLVGQYHDAGAQLLISSAYRNDAETHELLASDVMPHFA